MKLMNGQSINTTLSIQTLMQHMSRGEIFSEPIWVGGEIISRKEQVFLKGGDVLVPLDWPSLGLQDLDLEARPIYRILSEVVTAPALQLKVIDVQKVFTGNSSHRSQVYDPKVSIGKLKKWSRFLMDTHNYFQELGFLQIDTPYLVTNPGMEPTLDPVKVAIHLQGGRHSRFLPTSPELSLKKVIAAECADVYEIKKCFRDKEISALHEPEFTMLEWYRTFAGLESIVEDFQNWIESLSGEAHSPCWITVKQAIFESTGESIGPELDLLGLQKLCERVGLEVDQESDAFEDLYSLLMVEKVEPWLIQQNEFIVLSDFPVRQSALAKLKPSGWADRIEIYWKGVEVGNGFNELTCAEEQSKRFDLDNKTKTQLGKDTLPIDRQFLNALEYGLPPCSGIAIGMDRIFMILNEEKNVRSAHPWNWNWQLSVT
ncbi:MAG: amino acid--tRNA ligase-related protein [Bdellovibrionales bacterium]